MDCLKVTFVDQDAKTVDFRPQALTWLGFYGRNGLKALSLLDNCTTGQAMEGTGQSVRYA
jgi:hypothetical protein